MQTRHTIRGRIAAAAVGLGLLTGVAHAAGEKLTVEIDPAASLATLRAIVADAPLTLVRGEPTTIVETDAAGYKRLLGDASLASVQLVGGVNASAMTAQRGADSTDAVEYTIRLRTATAQNSSRDISASAARSASHSAQIVASRKFKDELGPTDDLGPGQLLIRGLDRSGAEVTRSVINDPRLIRYEAVGANKRLTGRRDFIRADVTLHVTLPSDPRVTALSIAVEDGGEKEIARVSVR